MNNSGGSYTLCIPGRGDTRERHPPFNTLISIPGKYSAAWQTTAAGYFDHWQRHLLILAAAFAILAAVFMPGCQGHYHYFQVCS